MDIPEILLGHREEESEEHAVLGLVYESEWHGVYRSRELGRCETCDGGGVIGDYEAQADCVYVPRGDEKLCEGADDATF